MNERTYRKHAPRGLRKIEADIAALDKDIVKMLREVIGRRDLEDAAEGSKTKNASVSGWRWTEDAIPGGVT